METTIREVGIVEELAAIDVLFDALLFALQKVKPNDRSNQDRRMAIVITEVEKSWAMYQAWFIDSRGMPES